MLCTGLSQSVNLRAVVLKRWPYWQQRVRLKIFISSNLLHTIGRKRARKAIEKYALTGHGVFPQVGDFGDERQIVFAGSRLKEYAVLGVYRIALHVTHARVTLSQHRRVFVLKRNKTILHFDNHILTTIRMTKNRGRYSRGPTGRAEEKKGAGYDQNFLRTLGVVEIIRGGIDRR